LDNFREEVAVRRNAGMYNLLYMLAWVGMIVFALMAMIGLSGVMGMMSTGFNIMPIVLLVLFGGLAFLIFRYKDELKSEYEYSFTNGELDVSKVLNNSRRRYLTNLKMKDVEAAGPVTGAAFRRFVTMPGVKKHNWFVNRDAHLYFFYFVKSGTKHLMVVEITNEMVDLVKKPNYMNYGIWQA
jgi:hypothetical protein